MSELVKMKKGDGIAVVEPEQVAEFEERGWHVAKGKDAEPEPVEAAPAEEAAATEEAVEPEGKPKKGKK